MLARLRATERPGYHWNVHTVCRTILSAGASCAKQTRSTIKGLTKNLLLAFGTLLGLVVISEFTIRLIYPLPQKGYGVWAAYPGSVLRFVSAPDGFEAEHGYNFYGFRGPDFPIEPPFSL